MFSLKKKLLSLAFLVVVLLLIPYTSLGSSNEPFSFIHFTDTHIGYYLGNQNTSLVFADIKTNFPQTSFYVHGGDLTELGMPKEYETYQKLSSVLGTNIYHTPGNHESRWVDAGKGYFQRFFGKTYTSWNYGGIHFVTLDSSIPKGQNGHFDRAMLAWLKKDLEKLPSNTPIVLFTHHPVFFDEGKTEANFTDNDWDLWEVIKDYNVCAIFTGHGHRSDFWQVNGISIIMTQAAMEKGYTVVDVNPQSQEMLVYSRNQNDPITSLQLLTKISLKHTKNPTLKILSPQKNSLQNKTEMLLQVGLENWATPPTKVEYKLEDYSFKELTAKDNLYEKLIDLTNVDNGNRTIWVRATTKEGHYYLEKVPFSVTRDPKISIIWQVHTTGTIYGTPALGEKYLYLGDSSGKIYAFEQTTGRKIWEYQTGSPVIASPTIHNGIIYVGSTNGKMYALQAATGKKLWDFTTSGSIIAPALLAEKKVLFGSSDNYFYALDETTGRLLWKFSSQNTIISKAAYGQDTVFFGSWDNYFYALDLQTGQEKWRQKLGSQLYYAPAAGSPLFYQGKVFISTPGNRVYAYDALSGTQLWEATASSGLATPLLYNDALVYSTLSGSIYALDPETAENVWQKDTSQANYGASPVAFGDHLLLNNLLGKLLAVQVDQQALAWSIKLGDTFLLSDSVRKGNQIFIGTLEGKLYALQAAAGTAPKPFPQLTAFSDTGNHWARKDLNKLAQLGLIKGYEDGSFRPNEAITRAELAALLSRYLEIPQPTTPLPSFTDITNHWALNAISAMQEKGIVGGYQNPQGGYSFKPEKQTTRAEAITMLARAFKLTQPQKNFESKFADLKGHWAQEAIMALEEKGYLSGYLEKDKLLFKPDQAISRAEFGVLLIRMINTT